MPIPSPVLSPLWQALLGGGLVVGVLGIIQKAVEWVTKRRDDSFEKVRADAASVEVARIERSAEEAREAREEARRLLAERKEQVAELKADHVAMRHEFSEQIQDLRKTIAQETEARELVKLSAEAAHIRADEAVVKLAQAKVERDDLVRKLSDVELRAAKAERHSEVVEREKNVEIEILQKQLGQANRKIEELERYIREHKMTVSLTEGGQTITASMAPMDPPHTDELDEI